MNKRELAKNFDVSLTTIDKWLLKGCPYTKKNRQYEFNLPDVIAWHKQYFLSNNQASDYQQSKAKKEHFRAELMRLEYEKASGILVERAKYDEGLTKLILIVKDALLLLPKIIPPALPIDHTTQKILILGLKKEIHRVLNIWGQGAAALQRFIGENKSNGRKEEN